ncbi:MAG: 50S ribosomal protein L29 [Candidatus Aureabacteria bacterium]|nr:50S ribosomal protein L29 [Candidatus Auribacterota bacterium]
MKAKEMREKTAEELQHLIAGWREELFKLGVQTMTGQMEGQSRVWKIRKDIARALTTLRAEAGTAVAAQKETKAL